MTDDFWYSPPAAPSVRISDEEAGTGEEKPDIATPAEEIGGLISPDGSQLAVIRRQDEKTKAFLWQMPNGPESLICEDCRSVLNWSSDSKAVLVVAGDRDRPVLVSLATREKRLLTEHPKYPLHDYVLSRDQRWLAFRVIESLNSQPVYISPVHSDKPSTESEWTLVSTNAPHFRPFWSTDGNILYFYAVKDNFACLYAQHLDPVTKKQAAIAVKHFHGDLRPVPERVLGYGYTGAAIYVPLSSGRADVWIAEPERGR